MGKGGAVIGIIGVLLGAGGLGFGIYSYFTITPSVNTIQARSNIHRTYFDNRTASYTTASEFTYLEIPDLSIIFQVDPGECVYFLFTCRASMSDQTIGGLLYMYFQLKIDNVDIILSRTFVGVVGPTSLTYSYSVALQYADSSLAAGPHEVVVETERQCHTGYIDNCYLLVQTYIP